MLTTLWGQTLWGSPLVHLSTQDEGGGADSSVLNALIIPLDLAVGAESHALDAAIESSDVGSGVDEVLNFMSGWLLLTPTDTGMGDDATVSLDAFLKAADKAKGVDSSALETLIEALDAALGKDTRLNIFVVQSGRTFGIVGGKLRPIQE